MPLFFLQSFCTKNDLKSESIIFQSFAPKLHPTFFQSFCTKKWPNFFFNLFALKSQKQKTLGPVPLIVIFVETSVAGLVWFWKQTQKIVFIEQNKKEECVYSQKKFEHISIITTRAKATFSKQNRLLKCKKTHKVKCSNRFQSIRKPELE